MRQTVKIYADGCCLKDKTGGWAAILMYRSVRRELYGFEENTTNNRMELTAVIRGLQAIKRPCPIEVFTDSMYVRDGIAYWIKSWKERGWRTASGGAVKNRDLWEILDGLANKYAASFNWLPGHSGIPENERADALANIAARRRICLEIDTISTARGPRSYG